MTAMTNQMTLRGTKKRT